MNFPELNTITGELKELLVSLSKWSGAPLFKEVRVAAISSYGNLFELLPDISIFPAAIVAVGSMSYQENAVIRELDISVIVIDNFRVSATDTMSTYELLDEVSTALTPPQPGGYLKLGKATLLAQEFQVLELDSMHTAWQFTLKATTSFN